MRWGSWRIPGQSSRTICLVLGAEAVLCLSHFSVSVRLCLRREQLRRGTRSRGCPPPIGPAPPPQPLRCPPGPRLAGLTSPDVRRVPCCRGS